ncbi:MAG: RrF2 family transcriptional regulator [Spirochaetales bacterium]
MVRIAKAVEYGLAAIQEMDRRQDLVTARDISEALDLPSGLLAKVMQRLSAAGIIASVQGVRGGYRLVVAPERLSFLDLVEAIEGPYRFSSCESGQGSCAREAECSVAEPVSRMGARITAVLAETSVAALLEREVIEENQR